MIDSTLYDESGIVADVSEATEVEYTHKWNGVGSGSVVIPGERRDVLSAFSKPGRLVCAMDGSLPLRAFVSEVSVKVDGKKGVSTELELIGASSVLDGMPLVPDISAPPDYQTLEKKMLTGPAVKMVSEAVEVAAGTQALPVVVGAGSAPDTVGISVEADFSGMGTKFREACKGLGIGVNARIWVPGDARGVDDDVPIGGVIVTVDETRERLWVSWDDHDVDKAELKLTEPQFGRSVWVEDTESGGSKDDEPRRFHVEVNHTVAEQLGRWGGLTTWAQGNQEKALEKLSEGLATRAASADVQDGYPFRVGDQFRLGDVVTVTVSGVECRAVVTELTQKIEYGAETIEPKLGEPIIPPEVAAVQYLLKGAK